MKKLIGIIAVIFLLTGCESTTTVDDISPGDAKEEQVKQATLYTNADTGSETPEYKTYPFQYTKELTPEKLAQGLSELTGLDFTIIARVDEDAIYVDWAENSTLIANLDDRDQKEEFRFVDSDSMRWFMMDSLLKTLKENYDDLDIIYSMNGGFELEFDEISPEMRLTYGQPYLGSAFFYDIAKPDRENKITLQGAFTLVENVIKEREEYAPVIIETAYEIIEGEHAYTFSAGENSSDGLKFTGSYHYAVTDSGNVYYLEMTENGDIWVFLEPNPFDS